MCRWVRVGSQGGRVVRYARSVLFSCSMQQRPAGTAERRRAWNPRDGPQPARLSVTRATGEQYRWPVHRQQQQLTDLNRLVRYERPGTALYEKTLIP
jgi:hypothetical protein